MLCMPLSMRAQTEMIIIDTSDYLPMFVSGALEYNLMLAASKGYYTEVERMILKGADVNSESSGGVTPLVFAVYNNRLNTVKILLQLEADPNHITEKYETPLLIATRNMNFEIAETLIRYGADVNFKGAHGVAPLHFASIYGFTAIADLLLYYDAEVDIRANDGTTPLMASVWAGYPDIAELLIINGANMEARDGAGFTPFLIAAQNGDTLIMNTLRQKGVDIYENNAYKWDALNLAIRSGKGEAVKMLLKSGDKWNDPERDVISPVSVATAYRNREMLEFLQAVNFRAGKKLIFDQAEISGSFRTDFKDFYSGFSISVREPLRSFGFLSGFDTKLWYSRVLIKEESDLFYQYLDKSSYVYAGIFKELPLTKNMVRGNYSFIASLSAGYSFGNKLKGTQIAPNNEFRLMPAAGFRWTKNNLSLISDIEFINTDFYRIGPLWIRLGMAYNVFFNNVRAPVKNIKWYQ